jgi:methoxymalonate biosynthesis protein
VSEKDVTDGEPIVKCLVWDLDNTLWRGTLLEDGDVEVPGEVQDVVIELDARGILQSVSSKNDHELALEKLESLGMAEYFLFPQLGWGRKSDSVREIARQLNFAHRAMAFIDDQPAERAEVSFYLPEVRCYLAEQTTSLLSLPEFSPNVVTGDAKRRREMYRAGMRRITAQTTFEGSDEQFLRSLDLVMCIEQATEDELARVEELTLRTSQMNATGVHYSDASLRSLLADASHEVLVVTLADRFGPHGAVGIVLLELHPSVWRLKLLATSCRVVSFGAGAVILRWLIDQAARSGVHLVADFRRTERNRMMEVAYRFAGFTPKECACQVAVARTGHPHDIQLLHLEPVPQCSAATMQVIAPDLGFIESTGRRNV